MRALLLTALVACAPLAKDPTRETARSVVITVAEAVHFADQACAQVALDTKRGALAAECADAYDIARPAALAAANAVDAWNDGAQSKTACALVKAAKALEHMAVVMAAGGVVIPALIEDALRLAPTLKGLCHE